MNLNIVFIGDSYAGRSEIIWVFCEKKYNPNILSTIGSDFKRKEIKLKNGEKINLKLVDTAGQERFHQIMKQKLKTADGVVINFDLTHREMFNHLTYYINMVRDNSKSNIPIVIFGNKCDLIENREIKEEEAVQFCEKNNIRYFETSSLKYINIKEGIEEITNEAYEFKIKNNNNNKLKYNKLKYNELIKLFKYINY